MDNPAKLEFSNACLKAFSQTTSRIPVIKRLYPSLLKAWARLTWSEGYKVKRWRGILFLLNAANNIDRSIGLRGGYEGEGSAYLFSEMEKGCDVFLDLGASIGIYSLQVAQRGLAKEIYAFDPDPRNFAHLSFNIYLNGFKNIQAHAAAVSSTSGMLQFEMAAGEKTMMSQVAAAPADTDAPMAMGHLKPGTGTTRDVRAQALDDMLSCQGKKIFFKVNIQGHELDALKGTVRLLQNNDCFLQIWIWPENYDRVTQYLAAMGYKVTHSIDSHYYLTR